MFETAILRKLPAAVSRTETIDQSIVYFSVTSFQGPEYGKFSQIYKAKMNNHEHTVSHFQKY